MNKSAILHIPQSQYAFAGSENSLTLRIRTGKEDTISCKVYYGDRACNKTPMEFYELSMEQCASDELFYYYEITFKTPFTRVCYYFKLESDSEWYYYYGDQFCQKLPDINLCGQIIEGRSEYFQYPFILRSEISDVPDWFKDAVVYNIFPDSYATGKGVFEYHKKSVLLQDNNISQSRLGGTIRGILDNLDYISDLGFNCIYLNPIFTAGEYHKYDVLDYYHIDPCFGTDEDFRGLVEEIHDRGMKIIIDGVFNHCSWYFFAFEDVIINGESSRYKNWFYELTFPVERPADENTPPTYACFAYERKMPKLNTANKEVQEYFAKICRYWIHEFNIDGWRLDVANEVDKNFWRTFRNAAKAENPHIVLIGEIWENSEVWLQGDMFDSSMNYDFRKHCRDFFAFQSISPKVFSERMNQMLYRYPTNITLGQLNLLDSHDVPRFLSLCDHDTRRFKLAVLFLMFCPGVPSLFYGDEKGISGIKEDEYRSPMIWDNTDESLEEFVKNIITVRKYYTNYQGNYEAKALDDHILTITRTGVKGTVRIYMNVCEKETVMEPLQNSKVLLEQGLDGRCMEPYGFVIYLIDR